MNIDIIYIYWLHFIYVGPIFLFFGLNTKNLPENSKDEDGKYLLNWTNLFLTQKNAYLYIAFLGIINFLYHLYSALKLYFEEQFINHTNIMHILFVAPLLIYIGLISKENTSYIYYNLLTIFGIGLIFLFAYKLYLYYFG